MSREPGRREGGGRRRWLRDPGAQCGGHEGFVTSLSAWLHVVAGWAGLVNCGRRSSVLPDRLAALQRDSLGHGLGIYARRSLVAWTRAHSHRARAASEGDLQPPAGILAAEFRHGPIALVESSYPILLFIPTDQAAAGLRSLAADLRRKNASVFMTDHGLQHAGCLPALAPDHPDTDAVCLIQTFYALAIRVAQCRGTNVDLPRHLQKVTRTR